MLCLFQRLPARFKRWEYLIHVNEVDEGEGKREGEGVKWERVYERISLFKWIVRYVKTFMYRYKQQRQK